MMRVLMIIPVLWFGIACAGDDAARPQAEQGRYSEDDPEYKLASIDAGQRLSTNDPSIDRYARALDRLEAKCDNTRVDHGDMAVRSTQLVEEDSTKTVTVIEVLEGVDESIPEEFPRRNCADIYAAWVTVIVG